MIQIIKNENECKRRCLLLDTFINLCFEMDLTHIQIYFNDYDDKTSLFVTENDLKTNNGIIYCGSVDKIFETLPRDDLVIESWEIVDNTLQFNVFSISDRTENIKIVPVCTSTKNNYLPFGYSFI